MLTFPALRLQQFAQELYLLNVAAGDVERLVRFEVLGDAAAHGPRSRAHKAAATARVHWDLLEKRIGTSERAFQRPIIRKKIEEIAQYYIACREESALPAVPGAVILTTDLTPQFTPQGGNPFVGLLQIPDEEGALRALDGQHRLLALAALLNDPAASEEQRAAARRLQIPAILFTGLAPEQIVELFVTINTKHTRLNPSLLVSLAGRQLYGDPAVAVVHDVLRKLNETPSSPLHGDIKLLGVGAGKVAQAGLAQEMKQALAEMSARDPAGAERFVAEAVSFYLAYFKEVARVFDAAWSGRKYSIKSSAALRALIRCTEPVLSRAVATGHASRADALRATLAPWADRIGSARFETAGLWRDRAGRSGRETSQRLAQELTAALGQGDR